MSYVSIPISYLTCNIKAIIPAANGAAAEVPVCLSVHPVPVPNRQSVVTWEYEMVLERTQIKLSDFLMPAFS